MSVLPTRIGDRFGDVLERESRTACGLANGLDRRGLEQEQALLVRGDEDRAVETNRGSFRAQLGRGGSRPVARIVDRLCGGAREVQLCEELGHMLDGRAPRPAAKLLKTPVFGVLRP